MLGRSLLLVLFGPNKKPKGSAFEELINSIPNIKDDGMVGFKLVDNKADMLLKATGNNPILFLVKDGSQIDSPVQFWFPGTDTSSGFYSIAVDRTDPQPTA